MLNIDELKPIPVFEGLTDEQLGWVGEHAEAVDLEEDDRVFVPGDPADYMYVVLKGAVRLIVSQGGQNILDIVYREGSVSGTLPYSRMTQLAGLGLAAVPSRILRLHKRHFPEMLRMSPELGERLVAIMSNRVRDFAQQQQQREKMMALGKLSAGLAHELNNPAAAIRRDVAELQERLEHLSCTVLDVACHDLSDDQLEAITEMRQRFTRGDASSLTTVQRSEYEDELTDWLEAHGVEDGYALAETFVDAGLRAGDLEEVAGVLSAEAVPAVVKWMETHVAAQQTLRDVQAATRRISDLVAAVKAYSHMDQAFARKPVDIHVSLDNTLTILQHRFKKKSVQIVRRYEEGLPDVCAFGGELNQIWTNLLDNAIDAVGDGGEISLRTTREGDSVCIEIIDNGPGIPHELKSRIFEPFFTTKGVGEGTGLGLDIVRRIVDQHHGQIDVESRPGHTVVRVRLPIDAVEEQQGAFATVA